MLVYYALLRRDRILKRYEEFLGCFTTRGERGIWIDR